MSPASPVATRVCDAGTAPESVAGPGKESVVAAGKPSSGETSSVRSAEDESSPQPVTDPVKDSNVNARSVKASAPVAKPGSSVVKETGAETPRPPPSFVATARAQ